jgi:hypothetical protein
MPHMTYNATGCGFRPRVERQVRRVPVTRAAPAARARREQNIAEHSAYPGLCIPLIKRAERAARRFPELNHNLRGYLCELAGGTWHCRPGELIACKCNSLPINETVGSTATARGLVATVTTGKGSPSVAVVAKGPWVNRKSVTAAKISASVPTLRLLASGHRRRLGIGSGFSSGSKKAANPAILDIVEDAKNERRLVACYRFITI